MKTILAVAAVCLFFPRIIPSAYSQSLGNAGTIEGTVVDQSGAAIPNAEVTLHNALSGYSQSVKTEKEGSFRLTNIPPNPYHLEVKAPNFSTFGEDVAIRSSVP